MKLWVPKAADTLAAATRNMVPDTMPKARTGAAGNPLLKRIAAANPTWLTSLTCKANKGVTNPAPAVEPKTGSGTSASDTVDCVIADCSPIWSGYQRDAPDSGFDHFSSASMTWTVPAPQIAGDRNLSDAIWPGIGQGTGTADSGNQLIQAGSVSSVDTLFGFHVTSVYPWLEIFPLESEIQITNFELDAGDELGITVEYEPGSPNLALFLLCNLTRNKCGGTTQAFGDAYTSGDSAEWIVERHLSGGNITSLNEFGTLNVSGAGGTESNSSINSGFVAGPSDTPRYMTDCARTQYLATPGLIDSNGNFTDTWQNYGPEEPFCKTPTG